MRIEVTVEIRNTEDERKVMNALSNVFSYSKISKVNNLGRTFLIAESNNLLSLEKFQIL